MADTLFDFAAEQARARNTDPATSHAAARKTNVPRSERLVLEAIERIGPATDEQVYDFLQASGNPVSQSRGRTARKELVRKGRVRKFDTGTSKLGNDSDRWVVAG